MAWKPSDDDAPPGRRRRKLRVLQDRRYEVNRRVFVIQGLALAAGGAGLAAVAPNGPRPRATPPIRPPSAAAADDVFRAACVRCGMCGTVCENGCIRFFGADETEHGALTPYLDMRRRSCTLCMRCTNVCPSGALRGVADDLGVIAREVRMGRAVIDPEGCLSYLGRLCGYCHDACPLPGDAIRLTPPALPVVLEQCVGCGRCEEECPQLPAAIRVERRNA